MQKIYAAQRLRVMAKADEAQAREYLKQLLPSFRLGRKVEDTSGSIAFILENNIPTTNVVGFVSRALGKRPEKYERDDYADYTWDYENTKRVWVREAHEYDEANDYAHKLIITVGLVDLRR